MIRQTRLCRGCSTTDFVLLVVFLVLAFVFFQRRGYMSQVDNALAKADIRVAKEKVVKEVEAKQPFLKLVDERIRKMTDARSQPCRNLQYTTPKKASIIMTFYDYQFYDLKMTLGSVLNNTPLELVEEIIIIDDGSTLDYIKEDSRKFVSKIEKARLEVTSRLGPSKVKSKAVSMASGDILVFVEITAICNAGWLEPLLAQINTDELSIAVPHFDNINDPVSYAYKKTDVNLLTSFSWALTMRMSHVASHPDAEKALPSAVMRGNLFAISKSYFDKLGGFDEAIDEQNGLSLELSFRTWLCGGSIKILPCSRVGVVSLNDPLKIVSGQTIRRIAELWIDERKDFVYKNAGISGASTTEDEQHSIQDRKSQLDHLGCKKFDWYLQNIAPDVYTPSKDARFYGLLKCKTGRCSRVGVDNRIDLGSCSPEAYNLHSHEMLFEFTEDGFLKSGGKCLAVLSSAYVVAEDCRDNESKHKWEHHSGGRLRNIWSNYCAMHVTDPDKNVPKGRQILMAQDCGQATDAQFITWEFIIP